MFVDIKSLKILGLNKEECSILQVIKGQSYKIDELSKITKIPRTSLYYILPRLEERGFIRKSTQGKKVFWKQGKNIKDVYQSALDSLLTNGENNASINILSKETEITILKKEKILQIFEDISNLAPRTRIYGIQPNTSFLQAIENVALEDLLRINIAIKQKNIIMEGIIHEHSMDAVQDFFNKNDLRKFLESFGGRSADTVKLPANYLSTTKSEIYLYNNTISIINWNNQFAISIKNGDVFQLIMEMFRSTKYLLQRYDQNEKIARKLVDLK